jgi:hypothetical protein
MAFGHGGCRDRERPRIGPLLGRGASVVEIRVFDIRKTRAILFGPSPYSGVSPGGGMGSGLQ